LKQQQLILPVYLATTSKGAIFAKEYKSKWMTLKREGKVYAIDSVTLSDEETEKYERFTPSTEEIESAEDILQSKLKQLYRKLPNTEFVKGLNVYNHLKKYARQYFGFILINNQKIIFINSFWDDREIKTDRGWLEDFHLIYGGGSYYWQVKVNLTNHQLFDFGVNGPL